MNKPSIIRPSAVYTVPFTPTLDLATSSPVHIFLLLCKMHPMSVLLGQFLILLFSIVSVNGVPTPPFPLPASLSSQASSSTSTASSWNGSVSASTTSSIELVNDNTAIPTASLSANPSYSTLLISGGKLPAKHWHGWDKVEKLFVL